MNKFFLICRTLVGYAIIGIAGFICFWPCFFIAALPAQWRYDNRVYYWFNNLFYRAVLFATFLSIKIIGKENISSQPAIIVANHQSSLDIPMLGSLVNGSPHIWLFLVRFAKIPLFGFIARRMNVVIDHRGLRKLVGSLEKTVEIAQDRKNHIMIFPEGGRYTDGKVHSFFYGFALLAKETKRPVVPVFMHNLNKIYPPGSFLLQPFPITVVIGKAFYFQEKESEEEFIQRVHAWFLEQTKE